MPRLIGAATAATTLLSMALGQISTGFEAFGVLLAAIVVMTLRRNNPREEKPAHRMRQFVAVCQNTSFR